MAKYLNMYASHSAMRADSNTKFPYVNFIYNENDNNGYRYDVHYSKKGYELKHHFCAADGLISNQWRDRLNSSIYFTPKNSPIFTDDYVRLGHPDNATSINRANDLMFYTNSPFLNLGYWWKITIEIKMLSGYLGTSMHFIDFAGTCNANKGFTFSSKYEGGDVLYLQSNFKLFGNSTLSDHPEYRIQDPKFKNIYIAYDEWTTVNMICTKYNNQNSMLYFTVEDNNAMQMIIPRYIFPHVQLNNLSNSSINTGSGVFGQFVVGNACVNSGTYNTGTNANTCSSKFLLKNIWIYEEK